MRIIREKGLKHNTKQPIKHLFLKLYVLQEPFCALASLREKLTLLHLSDSAKKHNTTAPLRDQIS